jgi:DNA-binding transcriptional MocR family regulator
MIRHNPKSNLADTERHSHQMELHIVLEGRKDLSRQHYRQLRNTIRGGRLVAGDRLPPSRLLSDPLKLARKTVAEAYARLTLDGPLASRVGRGRLSAWLEPIATPAGAHLGAWLRRDTDVDLLRRLARRLEGGTYPLSGVDAGAATRAGLFFGYGAIDSIGIDDAPDRLLRVFLELEASA